MDANSHYRYHSRIIPHYNKETIHPFHLFHPKTRLVGQKSAGYSNKASEDMTCLPNDLPWNDRRRGVKLLPRKNGSSKDPTQQKHEETRQINHIFDGRINFSLDSIMSFW